MAVRVDIKKIEKNGEERFYIRCPFCKKYMKIKKDKKRGLPFYFCQYCNYIAFMNDGVLKMVIDKQIKKIGGEIYG